MTKRDYDAVVVGSGPNGLAAAITMQQQGLSVLLLEAKSTIGGGMRSAELTLPGFIHDICSAIHPLAVSSPFFRHLPLNKFGLEFINPTYPAAHPFDDGTSTVLHTSIQQTAADLGIDARAYKKLMQPLYNNIDTIFPFILGPLRLPKHPLIMARFGYYALQPAAFLANTLFKTKRVKSLFAGMAVHSILPLNKPATAAVALVLMLAAHNNNWPIPKGGSQQIANALGAYFTLLGGTIETNVAVTSLQQLPTTHAVLLDVTPKQLLAIAGHRFSALYKWQLKNYRYGMGVYKIDWALSEPIPFTNAACRLAGTVHIGNTMEEIAFGEKQSWQGKHPDKPFVLLAQQSVFDASRAPDGRQTAWAYCHVPNGSVKNMTPVIEQQIERFAPGFKDCILAKHEMNSEDMQAYNANYIGGDINGGAQLITQLFTRPALRLSPYKTSAKGIYICSSSTPPGGGVHGMCGYHAAKKALKDVFNIRIG
ncbi:NAD(P)/FAD-dependent oxidoreductase [Ilyomonas limi]|uniref:NAD(P)/FAD-dependent oxidoreductase n=1 Tax=Ilyomonas limi TaxID=2575867 RepID=A0A4U3KYP9_9BACT|nr:NAD(P)/FAD-dependent oxidoreductase [Ilyomonas limi]TKK67512.1 NAD(P)/FAD-dependent oxidoreductase [Ilyomonas limi]